MDVSKLPRLSDTQAQVRDEQARAQARAGPQEPTPAPSGAETIPYAPVATRRVEVGTGAEVWLAAIIGLVFLLIGKNFAAYLLAKMSGQVYHTNVIWQTGPQAGQEVAYPDLQGFVMLTDASMFLLGLALLFEAAVMAVVGTRFRYQHALVTVALAVALAATLFNLWVVVRLFAAGLMPLMSLLAAAFGGYIASYLWKLRQVTAEVEATA
jgi:hypothetical protein